MHEGAYREDTTFIVLGRSVHFRGEEESLINRKDGDEGICEPLRVMKG